MGWLETGAALPSEIRIEETLYTYMEVEWCAEAIYRINESVAQDIQRRGASYFSTLGANREGEVFIWQSAEDLAESPGPQLARGSGPNCRGEGPPAASRPWPTMPLSLDSRGAYAARDDRGTLLIVYPEERLAYFWND
jgi:hypothetical protein